MGVADLLIAFNSVAEPRYSAQRAEQSYVRSHDSEWQVLRFYGIGADGNSFTAESPLLRAETDLGAAARDTATALLAKQAPLT